MTARTSNGRLALALVALAVIDSACGGGAGTPGAGTAAPPASAATATQSATRSPAVGAPAVSPGASASSTAGTTAACTPPATPTTAQTEGPYFKAGSPETAVLREPGMSGTALSFTGFVLTTACAPVVGAVVDMWQADAAGVYDNSGYRLRGHVATDAAGRFTIETIVPGEYPGRTEHIHVKVTPPGGSTLTTQVYFPGVQANDGDGIFSPDLLLTVATVGDGLQATFTFVVPHG